jgi:hypothetical protein
MYQGLSTEHANGGVVKFGFGASVVLHLSQRLFTSGHYQITELLKTKGINAAATILVNRFNKSPFPSDPVMKKNSYSDEVTRWSHYNRHMVVQPPCPYCIKLRGNWRRRHSHKVNKISHHQF